MSIVSIVLSICAVVMAWFTVGPGWLPLVTVAIAALLAFGQSVTALRAKNWGHWSLRALVLALVVLIALPTIGQVRPAQIPVAVVAEAGPLALPPVGGAAQVTTAAAVVISNDPPPVSNLDAAAVSARTASLEKRVSRTRFNLEARIAALGEGVDPAFAYLRDSIGFDSYPGVLRGDRGTFLARAGNSWDRASLLTAILKAKGIRTRFATARLDDRAADQLFERLFVAPATAAGDPSVTASPSATRDTSFSDRIRARATRDLTLVRAAMIGAWPSDAGISRDAVIEELREHAWVQAEVGAGWQDLDPSLSGSQPGQPLTPAESTFDEMPEGRFQHVTIRVMAETLSEGELSTTPRLEWSARAPDVLERKIFLTHVPAGTGAGGKLARLAGEHWRPALWLGGTLHSGDTIEFGSGSNSAGSFLFGESAKTLVAEWLELEFDQTGGRIDTTRRALFNRASDVVRAGAVTKASLTPVPMMNSGPVPALALHNLWFTAGGHDLAAYADTLAELSGQGPEPGKGEVDPEATLSTMAMANFSFLVWSDHVILPSVNDAAGVRLYADSPRALIFSLSPDARGPGAATAEYDLHRDRVRAVARDAALVQAAVDRKVWFGLLEGALEHELTAADVADAGGNAADYLTTSALVTELGVASVREGSADQAVTLAGDQSRSDRMLAAVARGAALVVPRPPPGKPARGWWEIAANGDTKAVTDGDLGGSVAWGKGLGGGRIGSGAGTPDGRMPRLIRPRPTPGGSGGQEYLTLLTTIALAVIIAFEVIAFTIHLRAVMRGMTVLDSMDRDFGSE